MKKTKLVMNFVLVFMIIACIRENNNEKQSIEKADTLRHISYKTLNKGYIKSIKIGNQLWMSENLDVDTFNNGDSIPIVTSMEEWVLYGKEKKPACCFFNNLKKNEREYGKLYNWYAINDPRGIAPIGWKIPSVEDFIELCDSLGGMQIIFPKLACSLGWEVKNGDDNYKFNAKPGGGRFYKGEFDAIGRNAYFWSSSDSIIIKDNLDRASVLNLNPNLSIILDFYKGYGLSVRCIKE